MKEKVENNYKPNLKIAFTILGIIVAIILLDSLQAFIFDNSPILKIRDYYNGGQLYYKDKGILVDTYCGVNGQKDTVIKGFSYSLSYENNYEIVDTSKEIKDISFGTAQELIYEDEQYSYYLPCIKSKYIEVRFDNGKKYNIIVALGNGYINIGDLDKSDIDYIKEEKTMMWKLENDQETIENVNIDIIKEQLNKAGNLEIQHLILMPSKNISNTKYIQTYNDINVGNPRNENEKFHIEICVDNGENSFKLMAKDNLTKEETEKIFIDYFVNNIVPDISQWYELEL